MVQGITAPCFDVLFDVFVTLIAKMSSSLKSDNKNVENKEMTSIPPNLKE